MKDDKSLLKDTPEYEDYSENIYYESTKCGCNKGGCCKAKSLRLEKHNLTTDKLPSEN